MPDIPVPNWIGYSAIIGVIAMFINPVIGLILLIIAAICYLRIKSMNADKGEYLTIILTSGRKLFFFSKNPNLLKKIVQIITESMNGNAAKQIINFNQSSINGCVIGCDTVTSNYNNQ